MQDFGLWRAGAGSGDGYLVSMEVGYVEGVVSPPENSRVWTAVCDVFRGQTQTQVFIDILAA